MRSYLLLLLMFGCAADGVDSDQFKGNVLLWRGGRMFTVPVHKMRKEQPTSIGLPSVHTIADVDASRQSLVISAVPSDLQGCKLLLGRPVSGFHRLLTAPSAVPAVTVSHDDKLVAYSQFARNSDAYDIYVYDVPSNRSRLLASSAASPTGSVSFRPGTTELTFEDAGGGISSIDWKTSQRWQLIAGKRPRWSHDGSKLAYRTDGAVYVYDPPNQKSLTVYRRSPWDGSFDGSLFWSSDDRYVAFNLNVGVDAPKRRCVVADAQTSRIAVSVTTPYLCGPFEPGSPP
jgi:hypothetical protein